MIKQRQNEEKMLRYQYAARKCFNRAEILNNFIWILCILSWFLLFLPDSNKFESISICTTSTLDFIALFLSWRMSANVQWGSKLRNYFDSYVLKIGLNDLTETDRRHLEEKSLKEKNASPKDYTIQISNNGHEKPPGVRDWYEFSHPLNGIDAVYECQNQNCWWNNKVTKRRIIISAIWIIFFFILAVFTKNTLAPKQSPLKIVLSSTAIICKFIERIVENARYYYISIKIDGAKEILENGKTLDTIVALQEKINERRSLLVLENNFIHKLKAKSFSELYQKIS